MEDLSYTGWINWHPTAEEWLEFYTTNKIPFEMKENQYLIVHCEDNTTTYYCYEKGTLRKFTGQAIKTVKDNTNISLISIEEDNSNPNAKKVTTTTKYAKGKSVTILPRNPEQVCAIDLLKDDTKTIKLITGHWGTGKTMLMVTAALEALKNGKVERLIWLRNNVDVKNTKDLGALPGSSLDKLLPFLGPFIDHCGFQSTKTMLNKGTLIVEPLQFIRGRNFENSIIMCSECENLTTEHLQLIIARAANGSSIWLDGDNRQRDSAAFEKSRGIETLIERLAGQDLFGYVHLVKSERSKTAAMADLLD